jgi:hypothetical protein
LCEIHITAKKKKFGDKSGQEKDVGDCTRSISGIAEHRQASENRVFKNTWFHVLGFQGEVRRDWLGKMCQDGGTDFTLLLWGFCDDKDTLRNDMVYLAKS